MNDNQTYYMIICADVLVYYTTNQYLYNRYMSYDKFHDTYSDVFKGTYNDFLEYSWDLYELRPTEDDQLKLIQSYNKVLQEPFHLLSSENMYENHLYGSGIINQVIKSLLKSIFKLYRVSKYFHDDNVHAILKYITMKYFRILNKLIYENDYGYIDVQDHIDVVYIMVTQIGIGEIIV